jgi:hypothetical protein
VGRQLGQAGVRWLEPAVLDDGRRRRDLAGVAVAPGRPNALYVTGGVVVAAQAWDQREDPDVGSVASVSADGGTTWTAVPTLA